MSEHPSRDYSPDEAVRTAFWINDLMVAALPDMLTCASEVEQQAHARQMPELEAAGQELVGAIEALAFALGMMRTALGVIRMEIPEGGA